MKVILVLLITGLFKFSFEDETTSIEEDSFNKFPYLALIKLHNGNFCAGTLISHRYVLTAAHCVLTDSTATAMVFLGKRYINEPFEFETQSKGFNTYSPQELIEHFDQYGEYYNHDIALIELSEYVPFSHRVQPAALPSWTDLARDLTGNRSTLAGWEINTELIVIRPDASDNYVKANYRCMTGFQFHFGRKYDPDSTICTQDDEETKVCEGDIRGPLVINGKVYGVAMALSQTLWDELTNFQENDNCITSSFNMFTKVTRFLPWIAQNTDVNIGLYENTINEYEHNSF